MDEKPNEIPAVRELLKAFTDLAGAVFTIDAMHTRHDTAQAILGRGAGYVMTVKGNMPALYRQLEKLPWTAVPAVPAVSTAHGRRARRTIKAALAPAWIGFAGAARVAQPRRTVTANGKKTVAPDSMNRTDRPIRARRGDGAPERGAKARAPPAVRQRALQQQRTMPDILDGMLPGSRITPYVRRD